MIKNMDIENDKSQFTTYDSFDSSFYHFLQIKKTKKRNELRKFRRTKKLNLSFISIKDS